MRISDWSSDVCSSDLFVIAGQLAGTDLIPVPRVRIAVGGAERAQRLDPRITDIRAIRRDAQHVIGHLQEPLVLAARLGVVHLPCDPVATTSPRDPAPTGFLRRLRPTRSPLAPVPSPQPPL